jgi:transcriptional regulator with XRE-family HTH domain
MVKKIKKLMIDREKTIADVAREIGKSRTWTSLVINGNMKTSATRKAIAEALGVDVVTLWPEERKAA